MGDAIFLFIRKIFHDLFIIGDFFRRSEEQRFWADGQFVLYYILIHCIFNLRLNMIHLMHMMHLALDIHVQC